MKASTTLLVALVALLALPGCKRTETDKPATRAPAAASPQPDAEKIVVAPPTPPPAPPPSPVTPIPPEPPASADAGRQIATSGGGDGVTACMGCHGPQGEGNPAAGFPRIAGQPAYYLARQMTAFAGDARVNPVMSPIARAMTAQQIRDVSAYYALAEAPAAAASRAPAERGRVLAVVGDESRRLQACANCHGPAGAGEAPAMPYLAGQHAGYLVAAMAEWKSGVRKTDGSGQMPAIARQLSDQDVAALASFFSAQPPPRPAGSMVNIAAGSAARPVVDAKEDGTKPAGGR